MTAPEEPSPGPRLPVASPVLLVLVAIASVQVGSSLAKNLYDAAAPLTVAWLRLTAAALILGAVARPRLRGRTASEWGIAVAYGASMALMNLTFYLSIERIPIGMAVTFEFLGPLGVAVAASRRARDLVWVGLAAVGVALLGFTPGGLDAVGVALALTAGAFWAAYIVLAGPTGRSFSGVTGVTVATWVGALGLTVPMLLLGQTPVAEPRVWLIGLLVGLMASVVPYGLEMVALRRIPRGVFGILMSLEPAAAALAAFAILGEQLRAVEIVAMGCVIVASVGSTRASRP